VENMNIRNFNMSGCMENFIEENKSHFNSDSDGDHYENRSDSCGSQIAKPIDESSEIIYTDRSGDGKNLKILNHLRINSKFNYKFIKNS